MFPQKKIYQTNENREYTSQSLLKELERMKNREFEDVSYTGLNLNMDMLMSQNIRDDHFKLIQTQDGLAKKTYANWHHDLVLAIEIFNDFTKYTAVHFHSYQEAFASFQSETGLDRTSFEYKEQFEQGNAMYFHDVLRSVFDLSRRLDLSINNFNEALTFDNVSIDDYPLPTKETFKR